MKNFISVPSLSTESMKLGHWVFLERALIQQCINFVVTTWTPKSAYVWNYIITVSLNLSSASLVGAAVGALFQNGHNNFVGRLSLKNSMSRADK